MPINLIDFESEAKKRLQNYPFSDFQAKITIDEALDSFRTSLIPDPELFQNGKLHSASNSKSTKKFKLFDDDSKLDGLQLRFRSLSDKLYHCSFHSVKYTLAKYASVKDQLEQHDMSRIESMEDSFLPLKRFIFSSFPVEAEEHYAVLLTVDIYGRKSEKPVDLKSGQNNFHFEDSEVYQLNQEFVITSKSSLCLLKDTFYCSKDFENSQIDFESATFDKNVGSSSEISNENSNYVNTLAQLICPRMFVKSCPSGFLFKDNVFYNDLRDEQSIDYSAPIITWIKEDFQSKPQSLTDSNRSISFPNNFHTNNMILKSSSRLQAVKMQDFIFEDIEWELNTPILLQHHENCRHLIVVKSVSYSKNVPVNGIGLKIQRKIRRKQCTICENIPAYWITIGDKYAPINPCYFCSACYDLFHLDESGKLIYTDFDVYRYHHS